MDVSGGRQPALPRTVPVAASAETLNARFGISCVHGADKRWAVWLTKPCSVWASAALMLPADFWVGRNPIEIALLAGSVALVLIVELLNSAVEAVVDRVSLDWHELSKRAKDIGSAAVLLALLCCAGVWMAVIAQRWLAP